MLLKYISALALSGAVVAQSSDSFILSGTVTGTAANGSDYVTGTYQSYASTVSLDQSTSSYVLISGASGIANSTASVRSVTITTNGSTIVTTSATATLLTASRNNSTTTRTATSSSTRPTNTTPCNGYPEFCQRKYSNITMVAAHNSPFDIQGNVASNQMLDVTTQLNDGIRMLQFQVHKPNATSPLLLCHSSCDLLNAGKLVDYLSTVRQWMDQNPYDVVTILMGNSDRLTPENYTDPVYNSGLDRYLYTPPTVPMSLESWPTLSNMIIRQTRLVMMLDYDANQTALPWLLDEFANAWETPFSPVDRDFPCNTDRPPGQDRNVSQDRLYIANHNLNVEVAIAGLSLLVPATTLLNETNAVSGYGSLGAMKSNCTRDWNRPPNFLLVDYYNLGNFNGSVFQIAADANGVKYDRSSCCGLAQRLNSAGSVARAQHLHILVIAVILALLI